MRLNGNQIRPGMVLEHQGKLWRVVKISHTQPGKGGAYTQAEMRDIVSGTKTNERFRSSETVERAVLEQKPMQYLYDDGTMLNFMDTTTFEQVAIPRDLLGEQIDWLSENMDVTIEFHEGNPIGVELPEKITMKVVEADAVVKGQTASSSYKPAKLENGRDILVPQFLEAGQDIIVSTADGSYVERA